MHYFINFIIIAAITIIQILIFTLTIKKLSHFKSIFPEDKSKLHLIQNSTNVVSGIETQHKNSIFDIIIQSINNYLSNNKGAVSDFHLMKDIVDRNCDSKEEDIHTQIPVPVYLGLAGTMLGILVGVSFLVFTGGLKDLLNSGSGLGAAGVEALLGGVAVAMISSIIGIILTTTGSHLAQNAKTEVEKNKNTFLSWMQAELLPNISTDTSGALVRMTENLSNFNETFSTNTENLEETFSKVNEFYQTQAGLLEAINDLKINDIATVNISVYDKLRNSTEEIGIFAKYLQKSNKYLESIGTLTQKLDDYENRTQVIENAGKFFAKNEKWLAENFDIANLEVKEALERFKNNTEEYLTKLQESLNGQILNFDNIMKQNQKKSQEALIKTTEIATESFMKTQESFAKAIEDQQNSLKGKLQETSKLVEELKNLTHIKEGIMDFKNATNMQSAKIDALAKEIRSLARSKIDGGVIKQEITLPKWIKIMTISVSSLLAITCLFYIVPLFIQWISIITKLVL